MTIYGVFFYLLLAFIDSYQNNGYKGKDNKTEAFKIVWEILNNEKIHLFEKLKIVLIYSLRYENDPKI